MKTDGASRERPDCRQMEGDERGSRPGRLLDEGWLAYFNASGQDAAPNNAAHPIDTREALQDYDPGLFALVNETMATRGRWTGD